MMHSHKWLSLYLWIAPHLLLVFVATLLVKRHLQSKFPIFAFYIWYEVAEFLILFTLSKNVLAREEWYVRLFLFTLAMSTALRFGVIQEIFNNIFQDNGRVGALAKLALRFTTVVVAGGALLFTIFASDHPADSVVAVAAVIARAVAIIQCGLVLFLLLLSNLLGISLRGYVFGIALGFGILSTVELANAALRTGEISASLAAALNFLPTAGYHVAVLIWLGYLIAPAKAAVEPRDLALSDLRGWSTELERFLP
jgi:hypothetical protein